MAKTKHKAPILGEAFKLERDNSACIDSYISELEYYRPRGFSKLVREGRKLANALILRDRDLESWCWQCDHCLTYYARMVAGHDYIAFGRRGDAMGFCIDTDTAIEHCDLRVEDTGDVPRGFSGLVIHVSDHGNVTAYRYSRGKSRELFAIV